MEKVALVLALTITLVFSLLVSAAGPVFEPRDAGKGVTVQLPAGWVSYTGIDDFQASGKARSTFSTVNSLVLSLEPFFLAEAPVTSEPPGPDERVAYAMLGLTAVESAPNALPPDDLEIELNGVYEYVQSRASSSGMTLSILEKSPIVLRGQYEGYWMITKAVSPTGTLYMVLALYYHPIFLELTGVCFSEESLEVLKEVARSVSASAWNS